MRRDKFERYERESLDITEALGRASDDDRASPDFLARVMAEIEAHPAPRPRLLSWFDWRGVSLSWLAPRRLGFAMTLVLAFGLGGGIGGAFTDRTVIETEVARLEATTLCKKETGHIIEVEVEVVSIQEKKQIVLLSPDDPKSQPELWEEYLHEGCGFSSGNRSSLAKSWPVGLQEAFAATKRTPAGRRVASSQICQGWVNNRDIKRIIKLSDGTCIKQVIDTHTGRVKSSKVVSCESEC